MQFPLRGRRVDLVPMARVFVPDYVRLLSDPSVARWTLHIPHPYSKRDALGWLAHATRELRAGSSLGLTVVRRSDGAVLGGAGLHHLDPASECGEVGYWLGKPFRGQGFATEAVNVLVRAGFGQLRLHRVEALVLPRNRASRRVLGRCGFLYEGRIRDEVRKDGRWQTTLLFSRLAGDPPAARRRRAPRLR